MINRLARALKSSSNHKLGIILYSEQIVTKSIKKEFTKKKIVTKMVGHINYLQFNSNKFKIQLGNKIIYEYWLLLSINQ